MAPTTVATAQQNSFTDQILHGDCIEVMRQMPDDCVDCIFTDPPYLVNYRDRTGRTIQNDADESWLKPAIAEAYRVLKQDRVAIMFYGWTKIDAFFEGLWCKFFDGRRVAGDGVSDQAARTAFKSAGAAWSLKRRRLREN